jgi:hypothetical protein
VVTAGTLILCSSYHIAQVLDILIQFYGYGVKYVPGIPSPSMTMTK